MRTGERDEHELLIELVWRNDVDGLSDLLSTLSPDKCYTLVNRVDSGEDEDDGGDDKEGVDGDFVALHYAAMRGHTEVRPLCLGSHGKDRALTVILDDPRFILTMHGPPRRPHVPTSL